MSTTTKIILGILGALVGLWLIGQVMATIKFLLPVLVVGALGYGVYKVSKMKGLPWNSRKPLP